MKKGDMITAIEGMAVGNIYDYMNRLKQLKPGQRVNVDVTRGTERLVLIVDL
jgi:S1-C subfamily serine protease